MPGRYGYDYSGRRVRPLDETLQPPVFPCAVDAKTTPLPVTPPRIVWRAGLDLNPLDVANRDQMEWLRALVWRSRPAAVMGLMPPSASPRLSRRALFAVICDMTWRRCVHRRQRTRRWSSSTRRYWPTWSIGQSVPHSPERCPLLDCQRSAARLPRGRGPHRCSRFKCGPQQYRDPDRWRPLPAVRQW